MKTEIELNTSWLNGNYANGEINTKFPYVAVKNPDFFIQGEQADSIINEIHQIWINNPDMNEEQAFNQWINFNL